MIQRSSSLITKNKHVVVFDLDDTLYKECDFQHSAFREIASIIEHRFAVHDVYQRFFSADNLSANPFQSLVASLHLDITVEEILQIYRSHKPQITLDSDTCAALNSLAEFCELGIITDGRQLTQTNKIEALGLTRWIHPDCILISETTGWQKPSPQSYQYFMQRYPAHHYCYVGDNPAKDFIAPRQLGWLTVCLDDDGRNIHPQSVDVPVSHQAAHHISRLSELLRLLKR